MNEQSDSHSVFYAEDVLEKKYNRGDLHQTRKDLFTFLEMNYEKVLEMAGLSQKDLEDEDQFEFAIQTARMMINRRGYLNMAKDMAGQIQEIHKEMWYQGEKGQLDQDKTAEEWRRQFAGKWRSARLQEIDYVFRRNWYNSGIIIKTGTSAKIPAEKYEA